MSHMRKGAASGFVVWAYSPGRNRKKKPKVSMCAIVAAAGRWVRWHCVMAVCIIWMGMGLTRVGGGSHFVYCWSCLWRRRSSFPFCWRRGSCWPSEAIVWPTVRRAASTVLLLTGEPAGAMVPTRYRWAKICRSGKGSSTEERRGSWDSERQKSAHAVHAESSPAGLYRETPLRAVCLII
jgi:hypothetical protein